MRLISTLWGTVKWKHVLLWNVILAVAMWWPDPEHTIGLKIGGQLCIIYLDMIIIMGVWNSIINGSYQIYSHVWLFSHVVEDVRVLKNKKSRFKSTEMEEWCTENSKGQWRYCEHGYFAFRKLNDAFAFKLRWI